MCRGREMRQRQLRPQVEEEAQTRFKAAGPSAEMTDELLAALIGSGSDEAPFVIRNLKGSARRVLDAEPEELKAAGAGPDLVFRVQAARELLRRYASEQIEAKPFARSSGEVFEALAGLYSGQKTETMRVLYLDSKNQVITNVEQFRGTVDSAAVYPREIIKTALQLNAAAVIVCHNHPSGDPDPSQCDREITRELVFSCRVMGMKLLDHLVVGEERYFSFADHGLIKEYDLLYASLSR